MKTYSILICLILSTMISIQAQELAAKLDNAEKAYNGGDFENTRFELQQALIEIDKVIGQEILGALPDNMGEMAIVPDQDQVTGTNIGFAGLYVSREYASENKTASLEIISDSPLLAGINTLLAMPMMLNSDPDQKRIKVSGYKALLNKETDDEGNISWNLQLPFGSSLLTFEVDGIAEENTVMSMINTIPVATIVKLTQ